MKPESCFLEGSYTRKFKALYIGFLTILISTIFFLVSYRAQIEPLETLRPPKIKEYSPNSPLFIPQSTVNRTFPTPADYKKETARISHNGTRADDPYLIDLIRRYWIRPPLTGPYRFKARKTDYSTHGQSVIIDKALKNKEGGFYVECGACDGEFQSNTLYLELKRKWTGLLIEPNRNNYRQLLKTNRKAYYINACLSPFKHPAVLKFKEDWAIGHLEKTSGTKTIQVQCFPFYSILLALNIKHIDVFSLDVEGAEVSILDTVPLNKVDISVMNVEYQHVTGGADFLEKYLVDKGYVTVKKVFRDLIVKKKELD